MVLPDGPVRYRQPQPAPCLNSWSKNGSMLLIRLEIPRPVSETRSTT